MTRFLALLLITVLIGLAVRRLVVRARSSPLGQLVEAIWRSGAAATERTTPATAPPRDRRSVGALARCSGCGVHVPLDRTTATPEGGRLCARCLEERDRTRSA